MKLTNPDFSATKLKKQLKFASAPMIATAKRPNGGDLEKRANTPPTQTDSSGGKLPPPLRPTYQGPTGDDPLLHTVQLVPGMQLQAPSAGNYSSHSKRPLYERN
ncbi:hypothetical protein HYU20_01625 [Candidatus Woesearchaeota archaeon]|nr:hypothetical protein [Candidatus Woesearchaeota archaeon]